MLRAKDYKQKKNYVMVLNNEHKHSSLSTHAHAHISIHKRSSNGLVLALEQHICCPSLINTPPPRTSYCYSAIQSLLSCILTMFYFFTSRHSFSSNILFHLSFQLKECFLYIFLWCFISWMIVNMVIGSRLTTFEVAKLIKEFCSVLFITYPCPSRPRSTDTYRVDDFWSMFNVMI